MNTVIKVGLGTKFIINDKDVIFKDLGNSDSIVSLKSIDSVVVGQSNNFFPGLSEVRILAGGETVIRTGSINQRNAVKARDAIESAVESIKSANK